MSKRGIKEEGRREVKRGKDVDLAARHKPPHYFNAMVGVIRKCDVFVWQEMRGAGQDCGTTAGGGWKRALAHRHLAWRHPNHIISVVNNDK